MSRFFSEKHKDLIPYVPGEQPKNLNCIKLNTNESPFLPSPLALKYANEKAKNLQLYSDPDCTALVKAASDYYGVDGGEILFTNGSDEILNFAFSAFCDENTPAVFPDITYGFYPVFAAVNNAPYREIRLNDDFTVNVEDYIGVNGTVFIANPNAPTGIALGLEQIEKIVRGNPENVVVVDEAYVDFGAESAVKLIKKYDNLLVTQTFSKSRSMAGARLGFGIGNKELIKDLNTVKYSTNPYNINSMTMAAGIGALEDDGYFKINCEKIIANRTKTADKLKKLGFYVLDSSANFIFAKHARLGGEELYLRLKDRGILVRHFDKKRISDFVRITIGNCEQMDIFIKAVSEILEEIL